VLILKQLKLPLKSTLFKKQGRGRGINRLCPLEKLQVEKRGWTLDVLQVVQSLGKLEFTLADVYAHAAALARLHPNNAHIRDKIRQQLQVLRDLGLLTFLGSGSYRLP
jgi:type II restriction enzyme